MARVLEQEVNLSRRACWNTLELEKGNSDSIQNLNRKFSDDNECCYNYHRNNSSHIPAGHCNSRRSSNSSRWRTLFRKLSQFISDRIIMLAFMKENMMLSRKKKHLIFMVLFNVLLLNCGCVQARPNDNTNLPAGSEDKSNIHSLEHVNLNSPLGDASSNTNHKDSALPSILQVETTTHGDGKAGPHDTAGGHETPERYPVTTVDFSRVELPFIIGIWILFASIAKIGFHMTPNINKILPESSLLIVVGIIIGLILYTSTKLHVQPLTPNTFFFYMLPPIILDAGYFMPNRLFFDNIGTILLMAVVGTIYNVATIGGSLYFCGLTGIFGIELPLLHTFLFASLISAVDPVAVLAVFEEIHVNEILYIVVFGESLLNDAVTVVLYHMFETYNTMGLANIQITDVVNGVLSFLCVALGGAAIGVIWGFLTGLVTRFTDHVRVIEPIFVFVMAYLAYLNAEIFHWSGILAITFCGITMKNYVEANISHKSHTTIKYALKMLSSSSETIIFIFLGVATVNNKHVWNTWFILLTIVFCSVFRVIGVIVLVAIANRFRIHKLSNVDQFVMSYGGLRGAIAFALVLLIDKDHVEHAPLFVTTTICVIYFTVFLQGITIKPLVRILNVKRAEKRKPTMNERIHERFIDHMMAGMEDICGKTGNYTIRDKFKRFDNRFIRPYLIRDLKGAEPKIIETYSKLAMKDAIDYMRRNPSTIGQMTGTESMSALFRNYTTGTLGGSPSFSNFESSTRNLDMQELDYNPSRKDLTDARIHHLLAEELKPYRRHRRLSYSRHTVDDRDLSTQVNYKMRMNIRRMAQGDRKHHKRSKRMNKDGTKQNHVSFPEFQQNGSAKQLANDYINEVLHENQEEDSKQAQNDDWEGGLTFIAKSSPDSVDNSSLNRQNSNKNVLIAQISNLSDPEKSRSVRHLSLKLSPTDQAKDYNTLELLPTAAESFFPWRRDKSYQSLGFDDGGGDAQDESKRYSRDSEGESNRVTTPTAPESILPWKREDDKEDNGVIQQTEFPSWANNKEYLAYNSPSATFLGLFRRESHGESDSSHGGVRDKRSGSISGQTVYEIEPTGHSSQFPVTASHRRNTRKGSLLEVSGDTTIPEEIHDLTASVLPLQKRGGQPQQQFIIAKTSPKNSRSRHNNGSSQQTRGLLSHSSDSDHSDGDVNEKLMKQQKVKKHFSVGSDDDDEDEGGLTMKRS